jgi:hypothetical protein
MHLPGQSNKPGNPDSQIIPELALFASIISQKRGRSPLIIGKYRFSEERYYDSDETTSWDQDKVDMIGLNNNTGDHYIK